LLIIDPVKSFEKCLGSATTFGGTAVFSFVIPSVPGFPTSPLSPETTYVVLPKENHMQLTEAATLDRKSGEAEGSAVRPLGASHALGSHKTVILRGCDFFDFAQKKTAVDVPTVPTTVLSFGNGPFFSETLSFLSSRT
jgi:hypothetical protein